MPPTSKVRSLRLAAGSLLACLFIAACALPRGGPSHRQVMLQTTEDPAKPGILMVYASAATVADANAQAPATVSGDIAGSRAYAADRIQPGDLLTVVVFENIDPPLLGTTGERTVALPPMRVDQRGNIRVPYAGSIHAAGLTEAGLNDVLVKAFSSQTPDPQIIISREPGDGAAVTVAGAVATQGLVPLTPQINSLTRLVAAAGGSTALPEDTVVTLVRGGSTATYRLDSLYLSGARDPGLRPGDRIVLREDKRSIAVLGAAGGQGALEFSGDAFSLAEALAKAGGLDRARAHLRGVFVYRERVVENRRVPTVYHFDFRKVESAFLAARFLMRDGDILYVSEAPFTNFTRVLDAIRGTAAAGESLGNLGG